MKRSRSNASFRDPSGYVFFKGGVAFRQVNKIYSQNYEALMDSGLYGELVKNGLLVAHKEVRGEFVTSGGYKIIKPETVPFISYAYEWTFGQLRDAALLTLRVQKLAMKFGMSLKDATSFNVQFLKGRAVFIDTLSFEGYKENKQWVGYRQFCEQFLAPLALMAYRDVRLSKLMLGTTGSIPLDLAAKLLPLRAYLNPGLLFHLIVHGRSQVKVKDVKPARQRSVAFGKGAFVELIDSLEKLVLGLKEPLEKSIWMSYYTKSGNNYSGKAFAGKEKVVGRYLDQCHAKTVWDLGANDGEFSRVAARRGMNVVSLDNDYSVTERNYQMVRELGEKNILPLWVDMVSPTPALGWNNSEREALLGRAKPEVILALALVHHLAIANNLPFAFLAEFFARNCRYLIIEFVPKEDSQVGILLANRDDIFPNYNRANFEKEFRRFFIIKAETKLPETERVIYLLKSRK